MYDMMRLVFIDFFFFTQKTAYVMRISDWSSDGCSSDLIAARAHVDRLAPLVEGVLGDAGVSLADVDAIAATAGPGLIGGVMVGLEIGRASGRERVWEYV